LRKNAERNYSLQTLIKAGEEYKVDGESARIKRKIPTGKELVLASPEKVLVISTA
jgi:hypothetical protein